jgi:hypothetical protein
MYIRGPAGKGTVSCTATVLDDHPTPALSCVFGPPWCDAPNTNPDAHDGHSPVGTVNWSLEDGASPPHIITANLGSCTLQRLNVLPTQPANQTPYASTCDSPPLMLAGLSNNELDNLVAKILPSSTHIDSGSSQTTHVYFSP